MELFDKRMGKEKKESLEFAEASRENEWKCPSFVGKLFQGALCWELIHPFPQQSKEDKEEGDRFLQKLEEFLKAHLNPDEVDITREIPAHVIKGLFEMGAFAMKIPKEYGGLGMSHYNYNRAVHLLGSYCGSTAALISAHQSIGVPQPLMIFGTEEQKRKYLPLFRQGAISGFALTEDGAGSDPRMITTTATPTQDGKHYLINGEKLWCTNGNIADILVVMAVTPPKIVSNKEKKQITAFIVETKSPGFEVVHRCKFMGLNAIQNGVIRFTNVQVPRENIILGEGEGLKLAFVTLNTGRLTLPAAVTGMSKWCLWIARKWALERKQWGAPIGEHEAVAGKLSYISSTVLAMEAMTALTSYMADNKRCDIRLEAAIAKLFCTEESWKILNETVQIRGGRGYESGPSLKARGKPDYPLERAMRDSRVNTILEGSSEIMHLFIAREALDFHLDKLKYLLNPKVSVLRKASFVFRMAFVYPAWYAGLYLPSFKRAKLAKPLAAHAKFIDRAAKKLARGLFHQMLFYQQRLVQKQNVLNRFVDIGMDLFAMAGALTYADKCFKEDGDRSAKELADFFCCQAKRRVAFKFRQVCANDDKASDTIARHTLKGDYAWLENDIIKI